MTASCARVLINGRFRSQPMTGVQRYATEVSRCLLALRDVEVGILPASMPRTGGLGRGFPRSACWEVWEQVVLPRQVRRSHAVLVNLANWGPLAVRGGQVTVVHDLGPLRHPAYFSRLYQAKARALLPWLVSNSTVVTVSKRVAAEIEWTYSLKQGSVLVAPPGVSPAMFATAVNERPMVPSTAPFALFVGAHDPRKRFELLCELWVHVWEALGLGLIATVRRGTGPALRSSGPGSYPWVHLVSDPTDQQLRRLYSEARLLVQASVYEGFGIPLLEAMAAGRPFLSTDVGAARELAAWPAWQIISEDRVWDVDTWMGALGRALEVTESEAARAHLQRRAKAHTWESAAAQVWKAIEMAS